MNVLKSLGNYLTNLFVVFESPQTYGSALEAYIVAGNPQNAGDIDRLQRQFDAKLSNRTITGWPS